MLRKKSFSGMLHLAFRGKLTYLDFRGKPTIFGVKNTRKKGRLSKNKQITTKSSKYDAFFHSNFLKNADFWKTVFCFAFMISLQWRPSLRFSKANHVKRTCIGKATPTLVTISRITLGFPSHCISNSMVISPGSLSSTEIPTWHQQLVDSYTE